MLRVTVTCLLFSVLCYVFRVTGYELVLGLGLRVTCYVIHVTCYGLRVMGYMLRI